MGPGRTGVKGVLRDRDEAQGLARDKRKAEIVELNKRMEKASLGGKTFFEEERERELNKLMMEGSSGKVQDEEKADIFGRTKGSRFGHLREVGVEGFVSAVEQEERGVWVVVHLYDPSVDRCYTLDETLSKLARVYPETKFLRCRAAALGFASTSSPSTSIPSRTRSGRTVIHSHADDDDDPCADEKFDDFDEDSTYKGCYDEDLVDTDVLPTMLVYQDGELVHNWVRVDWEADRTGVEELLVKYRILPQPFTTARNLELGTDDDDDLIWSDEEDKS